MSYFEPSGLRRRDPRRRGRGRLVPVVLALLAAVVVFGLGVAVGEALHDNPKPGGRQTSTGTIILRSPPPVVSK